MATPDVLAVFHLFRSFDCTICRPPVTIQALTTSITLNCVIKQPLVFQRGNSFKNAKVLMTTSCLVLGLAGIFALFAPDILLTSMGVPIANPLDVLIQLMGALYFSIALMNWTAKDSIIGGIYARPISFGNFAHFFSGTLLLAKYVLSNAFNLSILLMLVAYAIFAALFYWLVFRHTGIVVNQNAPS